MSLGSLKRLTAVGTAAILLVATNAQAATLSAPLMAREMMKSLEKVNTMAFSGEVMVETATTYSANLKKQYDFYQDTKRSQAVTFSGFIDGTSEDQGKLYLNVDLPAYGSLGGPGGSFQMIALEKDFYFNLTSDSLFNLLKEEGFNLTSLNGQWIGINEDDLNKFYKEILGVDPSDQDAWGLSSQASKLTPAQSKAVIKAIKDSGVMSFVKVADRAADAKGLYHLRVNFNKNKVATLVNKIMKLMGEKPMTTAEIRELNRKLKTTTMPKLDLLIGKTDYLPRTLTYSITTKKTYSYGSTISNTTKLTLDFSGFNLPVSIAAPSNFKSFVQVYAEIKAQIEIEEQEARRISDLRQLQTALELYYMDQNAYPAGSGIVMGSANASCLNAQGWQPMECANPYMSYVPADASSTLSYVYNGSTSTYTIDATLTSDYRGFKKGPIQLTPNGLVNL